MLASTFTPGRLFVGRLSYDDDLSQAVERFCQESGIVAALFGAVGAVKRAALGYYKQSEKAYVTLHLDEPLEIASCSGNISLRDGKPFLHAHISFSDVSGQTRSGHLMPGTKVFACEFTIQEVLGPQLIREYDELTGLWLWQKL